MDKRSILGFVLIAVILMGWLYYSNSLQNNPNPQNKRDTTSKVQETPPADTTSQIPDTLSTADTTSIPDSLKQATELIGEYGEMLYTNSSKYAEKTGGAPEKIITIENSKVIMEFSNYGGTIRKFITKEYKTWQGEPVQLVDWKSGKELHMFFTSKDGKSISTEDLVFNSDYTEWQTVDVQNNIDFQLRYSMFVNGDSTQKIVKVYTFKPDSYEFNVTFELYNSDQFLTGSKYQVVWGSSLNLTEYRSDNEATFSEAFAYMGGELVTFNTDEFDTLMTDDLNGYTDYVSSRNKYFGVFLIPNGPDGRKGDGAYLSGNKFHLPDEGSREEYSIAVKMDIKNDKVDKADFIILLSPIDYQILKSYDMDLQLTMRFAFDFMIRPIAQYFILPIFTFLHSFIPNYGLVIIVFAFLMKILLNPLTKKQMESMKKMGTLSPKMKEIREKYKDNPQKQNEEIMRLYKEEKINPAGGCLPMLLQLPILYALFGVFNSTIELRQQPFILWIHDLAAPDVILTLPFKIPLFGIDQVSGVAILMGITMFIQQKMTITDPKQKAMVYILPVMLTLLFFSFPSGLNLYYFTFNLLTIAQQYYKNKWGKEEDPKDKKPGFFSKYMDKVKEQMPKLPNAEEIRKQRGTRPKRR
jgi:YidC/Oxa1 family membrane protein insertase